MLGTNSRYNEVLSFLCVCTGNVSEGFSMKPGNTFKMEFSVPQKTESSYIQSAELWIFPHLNTQPEGIFQRLTLLISAELEHASRPRKEVLDIVWDMRMDCISLNITSLGRKISRNLQKNKLEQANISVSVELVSSSGDIAVPTTNDIINKCSAVADKQSNNPFFVLKYYVEQPLDLLTVSSRQRKMATASPSSDSTNCSLVPLIADLTSIFGESIIAPKTVNIYDCAGYCNLLRNSDDFSLHAILLERLKQKDPIASQYQRKASCVPIAYKPESLLFYEGEKMLVIVEFPKITVTHCGCR